ncbi:hypothetical protein HK097_000694 [Rhizophlyctis rosea]|uniref:Uncharacterized protein n=1 Tax=Rhizophlyctis rosea TaxID=64517 RepID=A0AAD5SGH3_9FUNG|nr:hypothetical protein HK097_000694 [Rhizophlyctis rosea]
MKQVQISAWGTLPKYVDTPAPPTPNANSDLVQIKVLASGLHSLVRGRATGKHYSANILPHIPGADGVGLTVPDNKLVYFIAITPQGGSFSELINIPRTSVFPIPDAPSANPVTIAGMLNPVMASWMALSSRVSNLPPNFTCVILGATSLSGIAAVSVARAFGAGKVIGVARSASKMASLGLDTVIELQDDVSKTDFSAAITPENPDVVLDFLYGPPTLALFTAIKKFSSPVQYVQIGTVISPSIEFPGDVLRSKPITMTGAGPGAWSMQRDFVRECPKMLEAIVFGKIQPGKFQEVRLEDIEVAWGQKGGDRIVVVV